MKTQNDDTKKKVQIFSSQYKTRTFRVGGYSVFAFLIILAIVVAANVFMKSLPARYTELDMTAKKIFAISEQTEAVIRKLDRDVTIYWIVQNGNEDSTVETLLERYTSLSDRIHLKKLDPNHDLGFIQRYTGDAKIDNNSLIVVSGEDYRYLDYYNDVYFYDATNMSITGQYDVRFRAEGSITSAINYFITESAAKVYVVVGHGEAQLDLETQKAIENQSIKFENINLLNYNVIPDDADCLLVNIPNTDLTSMELQTLINYMNEGGNIILVTDPPRSEDTDLTNWDKLTGYYGMHAGKGVVIETDPRSYAFQHQAYVLPGIAYHDITKPLTEGGYAVIMYGAQPIEIVEDDVRDTVRVSGLLRSSSSSICKALGFYATDFELHEEEGDVQDAFVLAAIATDTIDDDTKSHFIWFASSSIENRTLNTYVSGGNEDLFVNSFGYTCEVEDSISIHAKNLSTNYLTITSATAKLLTALIVFVLPAGFLVTGIVIWIRRRKR